MAKKIRYFVMNPDFGLNEAAIKSIYGYRWIAGKCVVTFQSGDLQQSRMKLHDLLERKGETELREVNKKVYYAGVKGRA